LRQNKKKKKKTKQNASQISDVGFAVRAHCKEMGEPGKKGYIKPLAIHWPFRSDVYHLVEIVLVTVTIMT